MKIRIKGNSVRYRLSKSEVAKFSEEGYLAETTAFPSQILTYALEAKSNIDNLSADFQVNKITLFFPDSEKKIWYEGNRVGYKHSIDLPNGESLSLLIEKDFACIDHTDEDQSDNYDNPNLKC